MANDEANDTVKPRRPPDPDSGGGPVPRSRLVRELREIGLEPGDVVMIHCRMSALGHVVGGAETVVRALLDATRTVLAGPLGDQYARYGVGVVFLRPDVAIAHKRAWATTADGETMDVAHSMIAMYVLVKEDELWWVAARQNTMVAL